MDNRYRKLAKNTLLVFMGQAGSSLVAMILLPFYTRWLSAEQYGTVDIINTYSLILSGFIGCCIADAIFVFPIGKSVEEKKKYFSSGTVFLFSTFAAASLLFLLCGFVAHKNNLTDSFFSNLWYIYAMIVCKLLQIYTQQFTRGIDRMWVYSVTGVVQTVSLAALSLLLIPAWSMGGYLMAIILSNLLAAAYSFLSSKSYQYFSLHSFRLSSLKELLKYGVPLVPNGIMWWLVNGINRPFMEQMLGLKAIGLFAVASKFPAVLNLLCIIFSTAWDISVIEEFEKPDFNRFFNRMLKLVFFASVVCGCAISIFSPLIINLLADKEYHEAWRLIPALTFGVILQNLSGQIGGIFMAEKKSIYFFYTSVFGGITSLIATYVCIKYFGLMGAPWAIVFSFLCMTMARLKCAWKYMNEMNGGYYVLMCAVYLAFNCVILSEISLPLKVTAYLVLFALILLFNKSECKTLVKLARGRMHI